MENSSLQWEQRPNSFHLSKQLFIFVWGISSELGVYPNIVKLVVKLFRTHRLLGAGAGVGLTPQIFTVTSPASGSGQNTGLENKTPSHGWFSKNKMFCCFLSVDRDWGAEDGNWARDRSGMRRGVDLSGWHWLSHQVTQLSPDRPVSEQMMETQASHCKCHNFLFFLDKSKYEKKEDAVTWGVKRRRSITASSRQNTIKLLSALDLCSDWFSCPRCWVVIGCLSISRGPWQRHWARHCSALHGNIQVTSPGSGPDPGHHNK